MLGNQIDDTLTRLGPDQLLALAEYHDKQAIIARSRAQALKERQNRERAAQERENFLSKTPRIVQRYMKQGYDVPTSQKMAASHSGVPISTIKARWSDWLHNKTVKTTRERNKLIFELSALGFSNVAIARRLGMHPGSICRILKKEHSKRLIRPNPERLKLVNPCKKTADNKIHVLVK